MTAESCSNAAHSARWLLQVLYFKANLGENGLRKFCENMPPKEHERPTRVSMGWVSPVGIALLIPNAWKAAGFLRLCRYWDLLIFSCSLLPRPPDVVQWRTHFSSTVFRPWVFLCSSAFHVTSIINCFNPKGRKEREENQQCVEYNENKK